MFDKIRTFISEVKSELYKANWPWESGSNSKGFKKYKELVDSTIVVVIALALLAGFVATSDLLLSKALILITNLIS